MKKASAAVTRDVFHSALPRTWQRAPASKEDTARGRFRREPATGADPMSPLAPQTDRPF